MHPADGQSRQRSTDHDSDLADFVVGPDCRERGEKYEDGNEEGQRRGPRTVGNLHLEIPVQEDDCSVSNKVHGPDRDGAHRHGGADQEVPIQDSSTPLTRILEYAARALLAVGLGRDSPVIQTGVGRSSMEQFQRCQRSDITDNVRKHNVADREGTRDNLARLYIDHFALCCLRWATVQHVSILSAWSTS